MGEKNVLPEMGLAVLQIALSVGYLEEFGEVFVSVFPMDHTNLPHPFFFLSEVSIKE